MQTKEYYIMWLYYIVFLCRELNKFIDNESYLRQDKFRTWMEGILNKVAQATGGCTELIFFIDDENCKKIKVSRIFISTIW